MNGIVISVQRSWKVEEVTSAKDEPPSMFVLEELCSMARGSAVDANGIAQQLIKKLNSPQPIVKAKALKAIKVLAQKGGQQFQKSISRHSTLIRELTRYSGPPDQFVGDVFNKRVRDAAGEAVEAIFNPTNQQQSSTTSHNDAAYKDRIKGIGGNQSVISSGFSNPTQPSPVNPAVKRSVYDKTPVPIGTGKKMEGFGNTSISYEQHYPSSEMPTASNTWGPTSTARHSRNESQGSYSEVVKLPGSFSFRNDPAKAVKTVGSEEQIVDEICAPGGIRAAPSSEDLKRFVEKASVLDGDKLAIYLENKITDSNWQTKLRALCGLEAVMNFGSTESCMMIVQYFIINPESIEKCRLNQQFSVKEKANEIYKIIGAEHPDQNGSQEPAQNQSMDLLADLNGNTTAPTNGNAQSDPFGMFDMSTPGQQATQIQSPQSPQQQQQQQQQVGINMPKTVSTELAGLTILDTSDLDTTNTGLAALDEAFFSTGAVQPAILQQQQQNQFPQQPMPLQQPMGTQQPMTMQQPMGAQQPMAMQQPMGTQQYPVQYMQPMTAQFPGVQQQPQVGMAYGMQQTGGMQYMGQMQQPNVMMGTMMQQQQPPAMMGQPQPLQFQQQQQYSMYGTTPAVQQVQSGALSPTSSKKPMTPNKGKVKKDAAFDFVQDHMANFSKK